MAQTSGHWRRWAQLGRSLLVAIVTVGGATPIAFAQSPQAVSAPTKSIDDQSYDAEIDVNALGTTKYVDIWGGLTRIDEDALDIHLTRVTEEARRGFDEAVAGRAHLLYSTTANTLASLDALTAQFDQDWLLLEKQFGIDLARVGPDPETGTVDVSAVGLTDDAVKTLDARYGANRLSIHEATFADTHRHAMSYDRENDFTPFNAGDFILGFPDASHVGQCTSAFGIQITYKRFLTAGHCFPTGSDGYNCHYVSGTCYGGQNAMGHVVHNGLSCSSTCTGLDSEYFTGDCATACGGNANMWLGAPGSPALNQINAVAPTWSVNDYVCHSGAFSGTKCALRITAVNQSEDVCHQQACTTYDHYIHENFTSGGPRSDILSHGDSGGPVYYLTSSLRYAVGTVSTGANNYGDDSDDAPFDEMDFVSIHSILDKWNATLLTQNN